MKTLRARAPRVLCAVCLLVLGLASVPAPAQAAAARPVSILDDYQFQEQARKGLDYLYNMDFAAADATFAEIALHYPDHPASPLLQALVPWWTIQLEPSDTSEDEEFLDSMERVLDLCEKRLDKNPRDLDAMFFKAGAHAFRGRLLSDRKHWLKAARDGQQALKYLQKVVALDPQNDDLYFGLGTFHYMADVIPKKYRILRPFARLFPKGDRAQGLQELDRAMTRGRFVPTEVAWTLVQLHYVFEQNYPRTLVYAQWLRQRYPDNALFHLYEARAFERMGRLGEATRAFQEIADRHEKQQTGYTDAVGEQALYVLSRVEMQRRMYPQALAHLERLEGLMARRPVNTEYRALGRVRRGMALDVLGRRQEAVRCYKDVLGMEHGLARDWAKGYLRKPFQDPAQRAAK
jgi:tetratricopeptide (TPR) repeat protein